MSCRNVTTYVTRNGRRRKVTKRRCTGKLVSGPVKFTTSSASPTIARVTLRRAGRVVATGRAKLTRRSAHLYLDSDFRLRTGRSYQFTATRRGHVLARAAVTIE